MTARIKSLLAVGTALTTLLIVACSTQAPRVDCGWRLKPINKPAPAQPSTSSKPNAGAQ